MSSPGVKRWSMDCKATVYIGDYSRGGLTRGANQASDHDMGCKEKYVPCGALVPFDVRPSRVILLDVMVV